MIRRLLALFRRAPAPQPDPMRPRLSPAVLARVLAAHGERNGWR